MTEQPGPPAGWLHVIIDVPPDRAQPSAAFWSAALGWPLGEPWPGHPAFASFQPPDGESYVHRQVGDHGPRVHLDLEVADPDADGERLVGLGAVVHQREAEWQVLRSPGGLPFCLLRRARTTRPGPQPWPAGHRSRAVQVCLDIPPALLDGEVSFWRAALGPDWRWQPGGSPEFAGKLFPDPRLPVQLLFQRLAEPEPATRAHLDLGTDGPEAEVRRLVELGAVRGDTGSGWIVLTDPAGMTFCVTENNPG